MQTGPAGVRLRILKDADHGAERYGRYWAVRRSAVVLGPQLSYLRLVMPALLYPRIFLSGTFYFVSSHVSILTVNLKLGHFCLSHLW